MSTSATAKDWSIGSGTPPLSLERLSRASDARVVFSLRRPLSDGTTAAAFTPTQLLERLAALVPAPKRHTVRSFGVFAPSAGVRAKVIREPALRRRRGREAVQEHCDTGLDEEAVRAALRDELDLDPVALGPPPMPECARRLEWASLLERVFQEDLLECACGGRRKVTAFIPGGSMAREILERLGVDAASPPIAKARARPHQEHFDLHPEETGVDPQYPD